MALSEEDLKWMEKRNSISSEPDEGLGLTSGLSEEDRKWMEERNAVADTGEGEPGWLKTIGASVASIVPAAVKAVGGGLQAIEETSVASTKEALDKLGSMIFGKPAEILGYPGVKQMYEERAKGQLENAEPWEKLSIAENIEKPLGMDRTLGERIAKVGTEMDEAVQPEGLVPGGAKEMVYGGVSSAAQNIALIAASVLAKKPQLVLPLMSLQSGATDYAEKRQAGMDPGSSQAAGILNTIAEWGTEKLPVEFLLNKKWGLGKRIMYSLFAEEPGELLATTIEQGLIDTATTNPDKTLGEFFQDLKATAIQTAIATPILAGASHKIVRWAEKAENKGKSLDYQNAIDNGALNVLSNDDLQASIANVRDLMRSLPNDQGLRNAYGKIEEEARERGIIPDTPIQSELKNDSLAKEIDQSLSELDPEGVTKAPVFTPQGQGLGYIPQPGFTRTGQPETTENLAEIAPPQEVGGGEGFGLGGQPLEVNPEVWPPGRESGYIRIRPETGELGLPQSDVGPSPTTPSPPPPPVGAVIEPDYKAEAEKLGLTFNGMQERPNKPPMPVFTDQETKSTFIMEPGESLADVAKKHRETFKAKSEPVKPTKPVIETDPAKTERETGKKYKDLTTEDILDLDAKRLWESDNTESKILPLDEEIRMLHDNISERGDTSELDTADLTAHYKDIAERSGHPEIAAILLRNKLREVTHGGEFIPSRDFTKYNEELQLHKEWLVKNGKMPAQTKLPPGKRNISPTALADIENKQTAFVDEMNSHPQGTTFTIPEGERAGTWVKSKTVWKRNGGKSKTDMVTANQVKSRLFGHAEEIRKSIQKPAVAQKVKAAKTPAKKPFERFLEEEHPLRSALATIRKDGIKLVPSTARGEEGKLVVPGHSYAETKALRSALRDYTGLIHGGLSQKGKHHFDTLADDLSAENIGWSGTGDELLNEIMSLPQGKEKVEGGTEAAKIEQEREDYAKQAVEEQIEGREDLADETIARVFGNKKATDEEIRDALKSQFTPEEIDKAIRRELQKVAEEQKADKGDIEEFLGEEEKSSGEIIEGEIITSETTKPEKYRHPERMNPTPLMKQIAKTIGYLGRKFFRGFTVPTELDSYWVDGSKNTYTFVDLATGKAFDLPSNHPFFEKGKPRNLESLPEGVALVKHTIFQGKDLGLTFYLGERSVPGIGGATPKQIEAKAEEAKDETVYEEPLNKPRPFYSQLATVVEKKMQGRMPVDQLRKMLKGNGVTDAEIENSLSGLFKNPTWEAQDGWRIEQIGIGQYELWDNNNNPEKNSFAVVEERTFEEAVKTAEQNHSTRYPVDRVTLEFKELPSPVVTKQQVLDEIKANSTEFQDVVLGAGPQGNPEWNVLFKNRKKLESEIEAMPMKEDTKAAQAEYRRVSDAYINLRPGIESTRLRAARDSAEKKMSDLFRRDYGHIYERMDVLDERIKEIEEKGSDTHFSTYQEPGAVPGSYREMFVTAPKFSNPLTAEEEKLLSTVKEEIGRARSALWKGLLDYKIPAEDIRSSEEAVFKKYGINRTIFNSLHSRMYNEGDFSYGAEWQDGHPQYSDIQNPIVRIRYNEREVDLPSLVNTPIGGKKPNSIRESLGNLAGSETAFKAAFNGVKGGMELATNHDQIAEKVASFVPVNVVNILRSYELSPKDFLSGKAVSPDNASLLLNRRADVISGFRLALEKTSAFIRAKVSDSLLTGLDEEVLPTLRTSDLNRDEIGMILSPEFMDRSHVGEQATLLPGTGIRATLPVSTGFGIEISSTDYTKAMRAHEKILKHKTNENARAKIIFVEEIQGPSEANQANMPEYLRKRIYDIGVKRVLALAKEQGVDGVAWTPGEMQAARYDLSKQVDRVEYWRKPDGRGGFTAFKDDSILHKEKDIPVADFEKFLGKEIAQKISDGIGANESINKDFAGKIFYGDLSGLDLKVGGEGLKRLYDVTLPALFKKYGKEGVGEVAIPTKTEGQNRWSVYKNGDLWDAFPTEALAKEYVMNLEDDERYTATIKYEADKPEMATVPFIPITSKTPATFTQYEEPLKPTNEEPIAPQFDPAQTKVTWREMSPPNAGDYVASIPNGSRYFITRDPNNKGMFVVRPASLMKNGKLESAYITDPFLSGVSLEDAKTFAEMGLRENYVNETVPKNAIKRKYSPSDSVIYRGREYRVQGYDTFGKLKLSRSGQEPLFVNDMDVKINPTKEDYKGKRETGELLKEPFELVNPETEIGVLQPKDKGPDQGNLFEASLGYHSGDLGYGWDTTRQHMSGQRGTGHFGTGVYFTSKPAKGLFRGERPTHAVDFSQYKLARPRDKDNASRLHKALKVVNGLATKMEKMTPPNDPLSILSPERIAAFDIWISLHPKGETEESIANKIRSIVQAAQVNYGPKHTKGYSDSASTELMKSLGYEGVDVRHIPEFDNFDYGSVIYKEKVEGPSVMFDSPSPWAIYNELPAKPRWEMTGRERAFVDSISKLSFRDKDETLKTYSARDIINIYEEATGEKYPYGFLIDQLEKAGTKVSLSSMNLPKFANAAFNGDDNLITMREPEKLQPAEEDRMVRWVRTFAHEGIHAIITNLQKTNPAEYQRLMDRMSDFAESLKPAIQNAPEHIQDFIKKLDRRYNTRNAKLGELITYGLTNTTFAEWLNSIPSDVTTGQSKTMWGKFKEIILDAIGAVTGASKTKLDELAKILDDHNVQVEEGKFIDIGDNVQYEHSDVLISKAKDAVASFRNGDYSKEALKLISPEMTSHDDLSFLEKSLSIPWVMGKKHPLIKKAFKIVGIDRPEWRGTFIHKNAKTAEPFFQLSKILKDKGVSRKDRNKSRVKVAKVLITGDAILGEELRRMQNEYRAMKVSDIRRFDLADKIRRLQEENRYSDEDLKKGIKTDRGEMVSLNQDEINAYKAVRKSLDDMFRSYLDHLTDQQFRRYQDQKWYAVLSQIAGVDLDKNTTLGILKSGLDKGALLALRKMQVNTQAVFQKVDEILDQNASEFELKATPGAIEPPAQDRVEADKLYKKISEKMTEQIKDFETNLGKTLGIKGAELSQASADLFYAYLLTRPQMKRVKSLRNDYKKLVAFFPRVRKEGAWKMKLVEQIFTPEGLPAGQVQHAMEMFDNRREGIKVYENIMNRYAKDGVLPKNYEITPAEPTGKTPEYAFEGVNDINVQKVFDDAIQNMQVKDTYFDKEGKPVNIQDTLSELGYQAIAKQFQSRGWGHGIHRQPGVIKGYIEGDKPYGWFGESEGLEKVLFNYMTGMAGIMSKQVAAADYLELMKEVPEDQTEMFKMLQEYGKNQFRNETKMDRFSNKVRSFAFIYYLGGVIRPALIQLTQNFITGIPKHAQYLRENGIGGLGKADKDYITSMVDVRRKNYTPEEALMEDQLLAQGVTIDQYIRDVYNSFGDPFSMGFKKMLKGLAYPFSKMEQFNRQSAALTRFRPAYKLALKKGLSKQKAYDEAFESARDYVYDTHYAMGKANLPLIAQGGDLLGVTAKTFYTFRPFTHNFVLQTYSDLSKGDFRTFFHSMAYIALFGGLMGLPFFKDLFEFLESQFGLNFPRSIRKTLRGVGGKTLETFGMGGIPAMLGANISASMAINVPFLGETPMDTMYGVYGGMRTKAKRAGQALMRGDIYRAGENLAPEVLRGPMSAMRQSQIGKDLFGTPGVATTTGGRPNIDEYGQPMSMGPFEVAAKSLGFQPTEFARTSEAEQAVNRLESYFAKEKTDLGTKFRIARINNDPNALRDLKRGIDALNKKIKESDNLVPPATMSNIVRASRERVTKQQKREMRYKREG